MNRRNLLIGIGGIAAGSGLLFGTGAFTSMEAEREIAITIADDASAYLGIDGHDEYTETEEVGGVDVVAIAMDDIDGADGEGVNQNAEMTVDEMLTITNQSANDLDVTLTSDVPEVTFEPTESTGLTPGEDFSSSMTVDTTDGPESPLEGDLTIEADEAEEAEDG